MEEQDDHGLNLSLSLKSPPNHQHNHTNHLVNPPPPSKYLPSHDLLLQMVPSPYNRPPNDRPITGRPSIIYKSPYSDMQKEMIASFEEKGRQAREMEAEREWERMNKEIVASIEEKRRKEAEEKEEREWERRQERKQRQRQEVEEEVGVVSSLPNSTVSTKSLSLSGNKRGEREKNNEAEKDLSSKYIVISEDEDGGDAAASASAARKKLMLSKDKAAVLEETFKVHNSIDAKQKIELAKQLDLQPRQVEVWFNNRRARTKLKQTEVNYDYLKTCCEVMGDENRRLKMELTELMAFKHSHQSCMKMFPLTTLVMCPQCTRVTKSSSSSSTQASAAAAAAAAAATATADAANTNHQNPVGPNHPKSTSDIPFDKLISSEALNVPRRLP